MDYVADRADRLTLRSPTEREDGSIVGEMVIATVGPMRYAHGTDYVPIEALADVAAIESLRLRPIIGPETHTPDQVVVTPEQIAERRIGHVGSECRIEGADLVCDFVLDTPSGIALFRKGLRAVSPGYTVTRKPPSEGDPGGVDYVQADRRYLHVALVEQARGGERVRIADTEEPPMELSDDLIEKLAEAVALKLMSGESDGYMGRMADMCASKVMDAMKPPVPEPATAPAPEPAPAADAWTLAEIRRLLDVADSHRIDVSRAPTVLDAARAVAASRGVAADAATPATLRAVVQAVPVADGWTVRPSAPAADDPSRRSLLNIRPVE